MPERQKLIDEYRQKNDIREPRCISDKILLYLRYGLDQFKTRYPDCNHIEYEEKVYDIYNRIRGEPTYTNKNPVFVAGSILYLAGCIVGYPVIQIDVAKTLLITEVGVRTNYSKMKKDLKL